MISPFSYRQSHVSCAALIVAAALLGPSARAEVRLPKIFGEHMVLQGDRPVPIWGWAAPGERVTVLVQGQQGEAVADVHGRWSLKLAPLKPGLAPHNFIVRGSTGSQIRYGDVLIGEVWLGSGQSNMVMELPADRRQNPPSTIRVFKAAMKHATEPQEDVDGGWVVATTESLAPISWVLYLFGKEIHDELQVPVGLVQSTWGGTPIQAWTPVDAMADEPELANDHRLVEWANSAYAAARAEASPGSPPPVHAFANPGQWPGFPAVIYNAMIHPLGPYAVRGFLWYQGENNVSDTKPENYCVRTKAMVSGWRNRWGQESLPFYFVQLPPFHYDNTKNPYSLTKLWQGQQDALGLTPGTAMIPTTDVGDPNDIHPMKKDEVAHRLASLALHNDYGRTELVASGPMYDSHHVDGSTIRVRFKGVGSGLVNHDDDELTWFEIAGSDGNFVEATARIDGLDAVVASSPAVADPKDVRFGWRNVAQPNLFNKEGWPAFPFSTVRW